VDRSARIHICMTCGAAYPPSVAEPESCPICLDDRQYVRAGGQQWTTLAELQGAHANLFVELDCGVTTVKTEPAFAIAQQAHLIATPEGNCLWDCISLIDDATVAAVEARGGIAAIAISHPHFYASMVEWSRAFNDAPIYLHEENRQWVMWPDPAVSYWSGSTLQLFSGITLVKCGGHFPGSTVLHWAAGADGRGALFTADTINVVADRRWVSFLYSYPNQIPLDASSIRGIVSAVEPFDFDRIYGGWPGSIVQSGAHEAVVRSADRYLDHIAE
jgi:hypothetical protein